VSEGRRYSRVEQARKVAVEALVAGDELVGEGQPRHQAPLLQPEDGAEAARGMRQSVSMLHHDTCCSAVRGYTQTVCLETED